jgi:hypothetical protein
VKKNGRETIENCDRVDNFTFYLRLDRNTKKFEGKLNFNLLHSNIVIQVITLCIDMRITAGRISDVHFAENVLYYLNKCMFVGTLMTVQLSQQSAILQDHFTKLRYEYCIISSLLVLSILVLMFMFTIFQTNNTGTTYF